MAKNKNQKKEILRDLNEKIKNSKSILFTSFDALGVKENETLRAELKKSGGEYYVPKKTLLDLALKDEKVSDLDVKNFPGKIATVFSYEDEVSPAKIVFNFRKKNEGKIDFIGGILEGRFINKEDVENLANLPTKTELYAKMLGSLNAPVSGFVNVLSGNIRAMINVLQAIADAKES